MTGPQRQPAARVVPADQGAHEAERVFVTAHPAEPAVSVVLRAGEAVLRSHLDDAAPAAPDSESVRRLFARHLAERLPAGRAEELYAAVTAAAVVAALDLALDEWRAAGSPADGATTCGARFRAVAPLLPPEPDRAPPEPRERRPTAVDPAPGRLSRRSPLG